MSAVPIEQRNCVVIFGGTFDPFHVGHAKVVSELKERFANVVVAPTLSNPRKQSPIASLAQRVKMAELVCESERIVISMSPCEEGVSIWKDGYVFAADLVKCIREKCSLTVAWAAGEEYSSTISQWHNWQSLEVPTIFVSHIPDASSSQIRLGNRPLHQSLRTFCRDNGLYQHGTRYC